jgi:hypothetical protein
VKSDVADTRIKERVIEVATIKAVERFPLMAHLRDHCDCAFDF